MKNDRTEKPFQLMALTVPAVEAAVGKNWLPTVVIALAAFLLCTWMSIQDEPDWQWLRVLRVIALVMILSWSMGWMSHCWPGKGSGYAVPALLLIPALYGVWKGSGARACAVLRYGMYLVLIILGILGLPKIKLDNLRPQAQLPDMKLAAILLLPLMGRKNGKWNAAPIGIAAVAAAILANESVNLYEYSRGLSLSGVTEHMESLAACAITVGNFALMCYLLDGIKRESKGAWIPFAAGGAAYGIYLSGVAIRAEAYVTAILLLWVIFPSFGSEKKNVKKRKIMLDKKGSGW